MAVPEDVVRKMNLIDICIDDHEEVPEPPDHAAELWSEEQIRQYFESGGISDGFPTPENVNMTATTQRSAEELRASYPDPPEDEFKKWFPGLQRVSGLLEWCRTNMVEILAVQLPGRGARIKEPFITTVPEVAKATLQVLGSKLIDTPYCIMAHSVGTWNSFGLLTLLREEGFPPPLKCFFSCFPSPDIPQDIRPWKPNRTLPDPEFMDEARGWDVNEVVFREDMWKQFSPLMRHDFYLFDEFQFTQGDNPPFHFPITTFFATNDKKVSQEMVKGWSKFSTKEFKCHEIQGHHLFVMGLQEQKPAKEAWYSIVTLELDTVICAI
eukprot:gene7415-8828_t